MGAWNDDFIQFIRKNQLHHELFSGHFALEKENVRVDHKGKIAITPYPQLFGKEDENRYIKKGKADSQIKICTPALDSLEKTYHFLSILHEIVALELKDEYLWTSSNPPILQHVKNIYETEQLFSGIRYYFSFHDGFLKKWHKISGKKTGFQEFKDELYLRLSKNLYHYRPLLIYLTGASPVFHPSLQKYAGKGKEIAPESLHIENVISLRNSDVCRDETADDKIVRIKSIFGKERFDGISLSLLDLNPFTPVGISLEMMYFIHLFLIYMVMKTTAPFAEDKQEIAVFHEKNVSDSFIKKAETVCNEMENLLHLLNPEAVPYKKALQLMRKRLENQELLPAARIINEIKKSSYSQFHLEKAREYLAKSKRHEYQLKGFEDLELSTQLLIKAAIKRGIEFKILDREDNFILLQKGNKVQYVKQATKTALDSYITALIMENKLVSKYVLEKEGIRVPKGKSYQNNDEAVADFPLFQNKPIVIKPKSTNFGIGITIFTEPFTKEDYVQAVQFAFAHGDTILLEEFINGKEYRFLVMGDEVVGILHRVPANVKGDGVHTIEELVALKNKDPLRGKGYKTPLEKIALGEAEELFLKNQGKQITDVPEKDEIVYLRENSNISTGGDSIDYTDEIPDSYKKIAVRAARAAGADFCGVDMMIENLHEEAAKNNYGIIEINFNPAIHIHCYPYKGKNRRADDKIIDLLFSYS